jgi:hypothetical protein
MWQPADMDMDGGGMISRSGAPRNSQFGDFAKIVSRMCGTASEQPDGWQE